MQMHVLQLYLAGEAHAKEMLSKLLQSSQLHHIGRLPISCALELLLSMAAEPGACPV